MARFTQHLLAATISVWLFASGCSSDRQLMSAIDAQDQVAVRKAIDSGADVNRTFDDEMTPLMNAAMYPDATIVSILIEAGADVNAADVDGLTPLMYAIHPETTRLLIHAGADVNARDNRGITPLMSAQNVDSVKLLLEAGADPRAVDSEGRTVFDRRVGRMARELIESYMQTGSQ